MDEVSQTIQTYDKIAVDYCKKTRQHKYPNWEENYIKTLLDFIPIPEPLILDVGCGDGRHCFLIDKNGGKSIGIDLSQTMVEVAKKHYPKGDFRKMDMRNLDFPDDSFHGIWSSGSIYQVPKSYSGSPRYFAYYEEWEMRDISVTYGFEALDSVSYPEEIFGDKIQQMWFKLKSK